MNELVAKKNKSGEEVRIDSIELTMLINQFREIEGEALGKVAKVLSHGDFSKKIKRELEVLLSLGLSNQGNISLVSYIDSKGEERPCYSLNRDGMLQMLNSESALVRYKTIEYINKLEENTKPKVPVTYKEALLALVEAEEEKERLLLENKELEKDNEHKQGVIIGLVKDISLSEKRQRITQIIRYRSNKYRERYSLLYSEFDKKFHINSKQRLENAKSKGEVNKSINRMAFICDNMKMCSELYDVACKVFCNDVSELMREMWGNVA